jgi:hypothetical protein
MSIDLRTAEERMEEASSEELRQQIAQTRDEMDRTLDEIGARVRGVRRTIWLWRGPALAVASFAGLVAIRVFRARRRKNNQRIVEEILRTHATQ